jgi:transposase
METGEIKTRTFMHNTPELLKFYQTMPPSVVGIEATSKATWFENMLFDNHHQMLVGNPTVIRKRAISRHKNDKRDACHIFDLLIRGEFPVLWRRSAESEEVLDLMRLRHNMVRQRTQVSNRLQALAHQAGLPKSKIDSLLFQSQLKQVDLGTTFALKREMLFEMRENFSLRIKQLDGKLQEKARENEQVRLLMTQNGVGFLTALGVVHTIGDVSRFDKPTKQVVAFVGLDPVDESSAKRIKFGSISKAGSSLLRFLLGQAAHSVIRHDTKLKAKYKQLSKKKHNAVAKTAIARRLLVKLVIMLRDNIPAQEFDERGRTIGNARGARGLE